MDAGGHEERAANEHHPGWMRVRETLRFAGSDHAGYGLYRCVSGDARDAARHRDRDVNEASNLKHMTMSSMVAACGEEDSGCDRKTTAKPARNKKTCKLQAFLIDKVEIWLRGQDLNLRPLGYEPNELPGCSTARQQMNCSTNYSAAGASTEDSARSTSSM